MRCDPASAEALGTILWPGRIGTDWNWKSPNCKGGTACVFSGRCWNTSWQIRQLLSLYLQTSSRLLNSRSRESNASSSVRKTSLKRYSSVLGLVEFPSLNRVDLIARLMMEICWFGICVSSFALEIASSSNFQRLTVRSKRCRKTRTCAWFFGWCRWTSRWLHWRFAIVLHEMSIRRKCLCCRGWFCRISEVVFLRDWWAEM